MTFYVTHKYWDNPTNIDIARKVTDDLQKNDLANLYICPLTAISCLADKSIPQDIKTALRLDLLCLCDKLIIINECDNIMKKEIELAEKIHMEIERN